tara:strand:- start:1044 stop:1964 length:921 start_codon:yes stop_codon:yes gene_type:complete
MTEFERRTLESPTGAHLALYERPAPGTPKAVIHINHGLAEHAARYRPFANYLSGRGFHVCAHDHRGHGLTTAPDGAPRRYADKDGWNKVMTDVAAVEADLRARFPGVPLFVFGHSMGGVIAFNQALHQSESLAGVAVWNSNLFGPAGLLKFLLGLESVIGGRFKPSGIVDQMTFKAWDKTFAKERPAFGWLSRDLAVVDAYVADPLCGWPAQISLWQDFADGMAFGADAGNLQPVRKDLPIHLVGGSKDPATEGGKAMKRLARHLKKAGFADISIDVLKNFRHETLNEIGAEAEMIKFADWVEARL